MGSHFCLRSSETLNFSAAGLGPAPPGCGAYHGLARVLLVTKEKSLKRGTLSGVQAGLGWGRGGQKIP